jgi:microcystin degradation protein MlrC
MTPRVGIVGMWQETNTYSPRRTTLADFEAFELLEGEALLSHNRGTGSVIGGFLDGLGSVETVGLISAGAWPAAPPDMETSHQLINRLESALGHAPDLDGLLVNLHGAMVTAGFSDMEAETLRRLRARYPDIPLMAVLDLHGNFSAEACAFCDAVVGYRTYPHIDMADCGRESAALMRRALNGERFVTAYAKLGTLTTPLGQGTAVEPMRGLISRAEGRAAEVGVDRVSLLPGFPYSDVARCGFSILAVATEARSDAALRVVSDTVDDVRAKLPGFVVTRLEPSEAVSEALKRVAMPVVLADVADNVGGGSPGDGTALLAELIRQQARGAVVIIADGAAVAAAKHAGPGAEIKIALGGHSDEMHGQPVNVVAKVRNLSDGTYQTQGTWMTGQTFSMGTTAVLDLPEAITVVVTSLAIPPFHIEQLTSNDIDPGRVSIIVAKGAIAWRAAYEPIMASAIEVDTPGCCPIDPSSLRRSTAPLSISPGIPFRTRLPAT